MPESFCFRTVCCVEKGKILHMILGIDIGTSSICLLAARESGEVLAVLSHPNDAALPPPGHTSQDPERIWQIVEELACQLKGRLLEPVEAVGISCQMHGILYLDRQGRPVSPLYTWQDPRGGLPAGLGAGPGREGVSWSQYLSDLSGYPLSSGFGLVTHWVLHHTGQLPQDAVRLCTIGDFVGMRLSGETEPVIHPSNAASLGLFDLQSRRFDPEALGRLGISAEFLPGLVSYGGQSTREGAAVAVALGDNQASFLGAMPRHQEREGMLLNLGTGGQISCCVEDYTQLEGFETRPYLENRYLLVRSSLCGGRAYAALERFFAKVVQMADGGGSFRGGERLYTSMAAAMDGFVPQSPPQTRTLFCGSRECPEERGSIQGLTLENLTPENLIHSFLDGMLQEFAPAVRLLEKQQGKGVLVGAGNGIRKNNYLQGLIREKFSLPFLLSPCSEEAALGAALFAARGER